jgi:hypothetical protein
MPWVLRSLAIKSEAGWTAFAPVRLLIPSIMVVYLVYSNFGHTTILQSCIEVASTYSTQDTKSRNEKYGLEVNREAQVFQLDKRGWKWAEKLQLLIYSLRSRCCSQE